jgi:hypothetical protein
VFYNKKKICITQYSDVHDYNTVHEHHLYVQFCTTEHSRRRAISMGTKIFNVFNAKMKLKNYLLCNAFYSLQEF